MILTKSGAAEYIRNLKPFTSAYDGVNEQYQNSLVSANAQMGQNRFIQGLDFSQNIENAALNAAQSRYNIMSSSAGTGFKTNNMSDLEQTMSLAYDSYFRNNASNVNVINQQFTSDKASIEKAAVEALSNINNQIAGEAENYAALYNSPMKYLKYLVDEGKIDYNSPEFGKYFDIGYENGSPVGTLRTDAWFESNFYDESGQLNDVGKDFFRQMLYGTSNVSGVPSFESWMQENNSELYDWSVSQSYDDRYDRNLESVFGNAGIDVENHVYDYNTTYDNYKRGTEGTKYTDSYNFGDVTHWKSSGSGADINYLENIKLSGANLEHIWNGEAESFTAKYSDNSYSMKIKKDAEIASDEIINDIAKTAGTIESDKLYTYTNGDTNKLYLSKVSEDGTIIMKEVTITSNNDSETFWNAIKSTDRLEYTPEDRANRFLKDTRWVDNFTYNSGFVPEKLADSIKRHRKYAAKMLYM